MKNEHSPVRKVFSLVAENAFGENVWKDAPSMKAQLEADVPDYANLLLRVRGLLPTVDFGKYSVTKAYVDSLDKLPYTEDGLTYMILPYKGGSQLPLHLQIGTKYAYANELDHVLTYCLNHLMVGQTHYGEKDSGMYLLPLEILLGTDGLKDALAANGICFLGSPLSPVNRKILKELLDQKLDELP